MTPHVIVWYILQEIEIDNKFSGEESVYKSHHSLVCVEGRLRVQIIEFVVFNTYLTFLYKITIGGFKKFQQK